MLELPDDACCLHCAYRLKGLTEARCPECGSPFDPEQIRMLADRPKPASPEDLRQGWWVLSGFATLAALWMLLSALFAARGFF